MNILINLHIRLDYMSPVLERKNNHQHRLNNYNTKQPFINHASIINVKLNLITDVFKCFFLFSTTHFFILVEKHWL